MTDIVERLRRYRGKLCLSSYVEMEAAQEIERLRKENAKLLEDVNHAAYIGFMAANYEAKKRGEA